MRAHPGLLGAVFSILVLQAAVSAQAKNPPLLLGGITLETSSAALQESSRALLAQPAAGLTQQLSARGLAPWLVQFKGPVQEEWKAALRAAGAELMGYIPENAFLIQAAPSQLAAIGARPEVVWVGEYLPDYKKSPAVRQLLVAGQESREYRVILFAPVDLGLVQSRMAALAGVAVIQADVLPDRGLIRARLTPAALNEVASWSEVEWIEPYLPPRLVNDVAAGANKMDVTSVWSALGLTGTGQVIAVCDTGLDSGKFSTLHPDFTGRVVAVQALGRPGDWSDTHSHGTHVAGSVLGSGAASAGQYKGMAYEAALVFQSVLDSGGGLGGLPGDLNDLFRDAYTNGARIHSDSWGASYAGEYTVDSRSLDMFVWSNKTMLILFAAGNDGEDGNADGVVDRDSMGSPATAKNCLTVGAAESYRTTGGYSGYPWGTGGWAVYYPVDPIASDLISSPEIPQGMAAFSSRGPCDDGRIKPDIVAPGTDIISARSRAASDIGWGTVSGNTNYLFMGGTSMATPLTAGAAGLARQWLVQDAGITNPSAALLKALLMNGARNMAPGQYGTGATQEIPDARPNPVAGWGHVDLYNTLRPSTNLTLSLYDTNSLATGESNLFTYVVYAATTNRFSITLAYSDYWAASGAGKKLVNDLDLTLHKPSGGVVYANGSAALDSTNNVETIDFVPDETGTYTVQVHARNVPQGGAQEYALVVLRPRDVTPTAPSFDANPGPIATTATVAMAFSVTASGFPDPVLGLEGTTASAGYSFAAGTGLLSYTPPMADIGARTFTFTASNNLGVATQEVSVVVYAPPSNEPPVIVAVGDRNISEGRTLTFNVTANDQDFPAYYDTITLTASGLPPGATFPSTQGLGTVTGVFTFPNASPTGHYSVTFHASDINGATQETIDVWVREPFVNFVETFDITPNWGGGAAAFFNAKTYVNDAEDPTGDHFEGNSATRETIFGVTSNAWRIGSDSTPNVYVRYVCYTNLTRFGMQLARWDNAPTPNFVIRYSTDLGSSYTTLLATNGSWFAGDKVYRTFDSGELNLFSDGGNPIWVELFRSSGERMLMDNFDLTYTVDGLVGEIGVPPVLTPVPAQYVPQGDTLAFNVLATPTDGDPVTLTASNLPSGATFMQEGEVGFFAWVNAQPLGVYTSAVYATDEDGVSSLAVTIEVVDVSSGGMETFSNLNAPYGLYTSNHYTGDNNIRWHYDGATRPPDAEFIDGLSIGFDEDRSERREVYSQTITGGLSGLYIKYRKSSINLGSRSFDLYVNTQLVGSVSDANNTVPQSRYFGGLDTTNEVVIKVVGTGSRAFVVDSLGWSAYGLGPNPDTDGDGVPDAWEMDIFGDLTTVTATSDYDGDRFIDVHEYLAGSDPKDPDSLLIATSTRATPGGIVVTWQSESNRSYVLSRSTNLLQGFTGIASNLLAVYPLNTYTDAAAPSAMGHYRVELE